MSRGDAGANSRGANDRELVTAAIPGTDRCERSLLPCGVRPLVSAVAQGSTDVGLQADPTFVAKAGAA